MGLETDKKVVILVFDPKGLINRAELMQEVQRLTTTMRMIFILSLIQETWRQTIRRKNMSSKVWTKLTNDYWLTSSPDDDMMI